MYASLIGYQPTDEAFVAHTSFKFDRRVLVGQPWLSSVWQSTPSTARCSSRPSTRFPHILIPIQATTIAAGVVGLDTAMLQRSLRADRA